MADKTVANDTPTKAGNFSERDTQLLAVAMQCMKNECIIDYKKFAELGGFKNSNSSKASWHALKKKIDKLGDTGGSSLDGANILSPTSTGKAQKAPNSTTKKRKTIKSEGEDDQDASPMAKKGRTASSVKDAFDAEATAVKEEPSGADNTEEECDQALRALVSSPSESS